MLANSDRILWIKDGCVDRIQNRDEIDIETGEMHPGCGDNFFQASWLDLCLAINSMKNFMSAMISGKITKASLIG
jgi:hypothetical protein